MSEAKTTPHQVRGLPVRSLRVKVLTGPATGQTVSAASDILTIGSAAGNDLVLDDDTVSRYHLELVRQADRILLRDHGSTNGTLVNDVMVREAFVRPGAVVELGRSRLEVHDGDVISVALNAEGSFGGLKGRSPAMRKLMARLDRIAKSDVGVLLLGETGTGKERIAEAIHQASARSTEPFEVVDCAALHPTLVASELFGHERGAFTGASDLRIGAFERANGGTIFLDEIGEIPAVFQAALLGALERRRFKRVGGDRDIEIDVRVISATHRDLRSEVNAGTFRQDLYYRIGVLLLPIPPLRERIEDLRVLISHFVKEAGYDHEVETLFPEDVFASLESHHWPGNVRELRNLVLATIAMGETPEMLPERAAEASADSVFDTELLNMPYKDAKTMLLNEFERRYVRAALDRFGGNAARSAREAGLDRSYLSQLIRKHNLR